MKTVAVELKRDRHPEAGGSVASLMYNGKAFDSCFPLRTKILRGSRESIRDPLFWFMGWFPDSNAEIVQKEK